MISNTYFEVIFLTRYLKRKIIILVFFFICISVITVINIHNSEKTLEASTDGYIKWVDFDITSAAMKDAAELDIKTHDEGNHISWTDSLAYLACKYGGNFKGRYKKSDLESLAEEISSGKTISEITGGMKHFSYYKEAYESAIGGMIGEYTFNGEERYGIRAYSPFAKGYYYSDYDDFGASRSYGYARNHLGHDMLGSVGTPITAIESGYVEACGWNQYGGWRIGIRSFDGKRYYYYAHLRKNHPYNDIYEGKVVNAGEVIGYLGMTGYSRKENSNNINVPHLHWGLQLIFDPVQKDGTNQIWLDVYQLTAFLAQNKMEVEKNSETNEWNAVNSVIYSETPD